MLQILNSISAIDFRKLKHLYRQRIAECQSNDYPYLDAGEGLLNAEQLFYDDTYAFLKLEETFFAVWVEYGIYISGLRIEKYRNGYLLTNLETDPVYRNKGYATRLILYLMGNLEDLGCTKLYSHIEKSNLASLTLHQNCGFQIISDYAAFVNGSVSNNSYTLCAELQKMTGHKGSTP